MNCPETITSDQNSCPYSRTPPPPAFSCADSLPPAVPDLVQSSSSALSAALTPGVKAGVKKSSVPSLKIPHKLLYPMKSQVDSGLVKDAPAKADGILHQVEWVGMAPLDMVQRLVSLGEKSPEFSAGLRGSLRNFLCSQESCSINPHAGEKRKRDHTEDEGSSADNDDDDLAKALVASYGNLQLSGSEYKAWKPSDIFGATEQVTHLESLVHKFERLVLADLKRKWIYPSFNRVQKACVSQVSNGVYAVLELSIKKMQTLVEMVSAEEPDVKAIASRFSTANALLALDKPTVKTAKRLPIRRPAARNLKDKKGAKAKMNDTFQICMQVWLKHNFANPFPDDVMLKRLAIYMIFQLRCITVSKSDVAIFVGNSRSEYYKNMMTIATEKISNWLVNQRTRVWRPSIERAFDQRRPSALLLEDAVRFYEKKELLPLPGWDGDYLFSFDRQYSSSLKTWRSRRKGKRNKTTKAGGGKKKDASRVSKSPKSDSDGKIPKSKSNGTSPKSDGDGKSPKVLSNANSPPPPGISPLCGHLDKLLAAEHIVSNIPSAENFVSNCDAAAGTYSDFAEV